MLITSVIGIDIAKDTFALCWAATPEALSVVHTFDNTPAGCEATHALLMAHDVAPTTSLVVLEATGVSWEACALWFHQHGYQVSVVNPARVAAFARSELRRSKTDAIFKELLSLLRPCRIAHYYTGWVGE